jgi:hypothetical protein
VGDLRHAVIGSRFLELVTLSDLADLTHRVPAEIRDDLRSAREAYRRKGAVAEALVAAGFVEEAVPFARASYQQAKKVALGSVGAFVGAPSRRAALRIAAADRASSESKPGEREIRALLRGTAVFDRLCRRVATSPADLQFRRGLRFGLLVVALGALLISRRPAIKAIAPVSYSEQYPPEAILDGKVETSWFLPDKEVGAISVEMRPSREVGKVSVLNGTNSQHDRGTKDLRIQAYFGTRLVRTATVQFGDIGSAAGWRSVPIGARIDRLRLEILTWRGHGGGIAEVKLE